LASILIPKMSIKKNKSPNPWSLHPSRLEMYCVFCKTKASFLTFTTLETLSILPENAILTPWVGLLAGILGALQEDG
jgi:hypothetical protein